MGHSNTAASIGEEEAICIITTSINLNIKSQIFPLYKDILKSPVERKDAKEAEAQIDADGESSFIKQFHNYTEDDSQERPNQSRIM